MRVTYVVLIHYEAQMLSDELLPTLTFFFFSSAAIFSRPDPSRMNFTNRGHSVPLSLICDNIRDPGNLGTMLRCAAAAGCRDVLLTKGTLMLLIKDMTPPVENGFTSLPVVVHICLFFHRQVASMLGSLKSCVQQWVPISASPSIIAQAGTILKITSLTL